ncbi:Protein yellow [Gryllus bimaculatus]|nr:Protein yellow [Gryllus bimaculatus]
MRPRWVAVALWGLVAPPRLQRPRLIHVGSFAFASTRPPPGDSAARDTRRRNSTPSRRDARPIDKCRRLWVIDCGVVDIGNTFQHKCPPQLLVFDLKTDELIARHRFNVPANDNETTFMLNVIAEQKGGFCSDDAFAYIADTGAFAMYVFSLRSQRHTRLPIHRFSKSAGEALAMNSVMLFHQMGTESIYCWDTSTEYTSDNHHVVEHNSTILHFVTGMKAISQGYPEELWVIDDNGQRVFTGEFQANQPRTVNIVRGYNQHANPSVSEHEVALRSPPVLWYRDLPVS